MKSWVKICGITNEPDAAAAIEYGADMLGIIFAKSARTVRDDQAERISVLCKGERKVKLVGVFKDAQAAVIEKTIKKYSLDMVQCHGAETSKFCWSLHFPVIKVIELTPGAIDAREQLMKQIDEYGPVSKYLLFDRSKSLAFDAEWLTGALELLKDVHVPVPYFFAGGLNTENVRTVLTTLSPFGVDVASGIESQIGKKDIVKLRQFLRAVQGQDAGNNRNK